MSFNYQKRSNFRTTRNTNYRKSGYGGSARPKVKRGKYIDPARFVQVAKPTEATQYQATHRFEDFAINPVLKANLAAQGYSEPTPIQDQTIPAALEGKDIIGIAHTGTGKTAAFMIPLLHKLLSTPGSKALIVAPTRELAQQIEAESRKIAKGSGLYGALLIGGSSMGYQLKDLKRKPQIIIGTPGRIKDHVDRGTLVLAAFNIVVLDEVDRMLDMGFVKEVKRIFSQISTNRQSLFFSATLNEEVKGLIHSLANDPVTVSLRTSSTNESVNQNVVRYGSTHDKLDKLHDTLIQGNVTKAIVFNETQRGVEQLGKELVSRGFQAASIHGGKSQGQRQRALRQFKENEVNVLVATDVAARGIDVIDITHVINYSVPQTYDDYIHRIGRTGRAGRIGHALTFVAT